MTLFNNGIFKICLATGKFQCNPADDNNTKLLTNFGYFSVNEMDYFLKK